MPLPQMVSLMHLLVGMGKCVLIYIVETGIGYYAAKEKGST